MGFKNHWKWFIILTTGLVVFCILIASLTPVKPIIMLVVFYGLDGALAWILVFGLPFSTSRNTGYSTREVTSHSSDPNAPLYKYRTVFAVIWVITLIGFAVGMVALL